MLSQIAGRVIPALRHQRRRLSEQTAALSALRQRVRELLGRLKDQERLVALATEGADELRDYARHHRAATRRAARLARSTEPILVGPWCGEVGFELLYWIPFVRWMAERAHLDGGRLVVVTRGGAGVWYRDLAAGGVEIFDLIGSDAFRDHADTWKQHQVSRFDRQLLDAARRSRAPGRVRLLHPQVMYRLLTPYWKEEAVLEPIDAFLRHRPLPPPPEHPVQRELPGDYVAAKFYFSRPFPDVPANRAFVERTLASIAERMPVVLLSAGARLDDHHDAGVAAHPRIHRIHADVRDNLAAQSAVVSRARGFVGTYGGFSYLAPLYGVPSLSFFSERGSLVPFHLEYAQRAFAAPGLGRFVALDVADAGLVSTTAFASPQSAAP